MSDSLTQLRALPNPFAALLREVEQTVTRTTTSLLGREKTVLSREKTVHDRERRATDRFQAEVVCEDRLNGTSTFRLTWDLSTFGLSTQYGPALPHGTRLQLWLHLPDDQPMPVEVTAEVVGQNDHSGGMRLAFRSPSAESARRIHRYLFSKPRSNPKPFARA